MSEQRNLSQEFRARLLDLMKEYDVKLEENESYDGDERYCGSEYIFVSRFNPETHRHDVYLSLDALK